MFPFRFLYTSGFAWIWIAILVFIADRYSKLWVMTHLNFHEAVPILPFFNLTLAFNSGAAFSFLHSASGWQNRFLFTLAMLISACVIYWLIKLSRHAYWVNIALCFILGGALGNAWDRVVYGYVIDFLSFHLGDWYFAIFNLADSAICIGGFMLFVYWAFCHPERSEGSA